MKESDINLKNENYAINQTGYKYTLSSDPKMSANKNDLFQVDFSRRLHTIFVFVLRSYVARCSDCVFLISKLVRFYYFNYWKTMRNRKEVRKKCEDLKTY